MFRRSDAGYWQGIAGGGEGNETPIQAARRESEEEAGILPRSSYLRLDVLPKLPVEEVVGSRLWGDDVSVIPEYCFGVEVFNKDLELSSEHTEYRWLPLDAAINLLHWESNKAALRELDDRLSHETAE